MGVIENFLGGIGSIIQGFINSILALVDGVVQVAQNIIFAFIALVTSLVHAVFALFGNALNFVMSNLAVLIVLVGGYFVYTTFFVQQRQGTRKTGTKKRV